MHDKSHVFFDTMVLLGTPNINQTKKPIHLVGYNIDGKSYWVATDRFDLLAEQVALIYKLRWDIESFFAWWKRHLNVYHLFARSKNGLMVQILSGLITYLLLVSPSGMVETPRLQAKKSLKLSLCDVTKSVLILKQT